MMSGIFIGSLLVLNTSSWPIAWLGLELNLMSFVPAAMNKEKSKKPAMTYFIAQSCGSLMILLGGLMLDMSSFSKAVILTGILLKMGLMPLHYWVPLIANSLKNFFLYILLSWQKIAPLSILCLYYLKNNLIPFFNALAGAMMMMSMTIIPLLMVFSGMIQMSWIINLEGGFFVYYTGLYFLVLGIVMIYFKNGGMNFSWALLNAGGLPPLTGFMIKLKAILRIKNWMASLLIVASGMALTSYSRFLVNSKFFDNSLKPLLLTTSTLGMV
uniref:NADH-ubiquinone oxidoreductase chain 2 n=1 Tax=Parasagitta setosa TaxID=366441 RepID=A0A141CKS1_9BILA|nr:NADH dehydrogenase subunit 2 [Parasagitta setosa]